MTAQITRHLERAAARVERDLLPDRCEVETISGTPSVDPMGVHTIQKIKITRNGSTLIPCRIDESRAFRPEQLPNQEINANEYVLTLPRDIYVKPNDKVLITRGSQTHTFEVRKITSLSEWRIVTEALIVELEGQYD